MADILTQAEIDALIAAMVNEGQESDGAQQAAQAGQGHKRIRSYDFRRPDKFSKDQIRTLQMIHENFIRPLQTDFAGRFRTMVQMVVGSVDQNTYGEFIRSVSNPSVICPFTMAPLPGTCVLDINPVVAFPMIDRLFGGPGGALPQVRALTEIEGAVMQSVIKGLLNAYVEAWRNVYDLRMAPGNIETNPMFVQVAAPSEIVITVAIDVRVGEHVGVITLCLPHLTLEPILDRLSAHNWFKTQSREVLPADAAALEEAVGEARVGVVAELGRADLTVGDVLNLSVGDVVLLENRLTDPVRVLVGNQPKFIGRPGQQRNRLVVEILGDATKGEDEDA
ncbi:MAG TPA: flagellar motor switch protein FliM [Symbiobacteriaceae bacterium]|nr:flagellar motor switch protein FliM [Symbiobacteriaceae bacterium]